jgi:hypothetical protein
MEDIFVPIALFAMVAVIVIGLPIAKAWARRMDKQPVLPSSPGTSEVLARLERMEQALEVMSTEIERITEGQRFVTRLLSESRQPLPVGAAPAALPTGQRASSGESPGESPSASPASPPARPEEGTVLHDAVRRS